MKKSRGLRTNGCCGNTSVPGVPCGYGLYGAAPCPARELPAALFVQLRAPTLWPQVLHEPLFQNISFEKTLGDAAGPPHVLVHPP